MSLAALTGLSQPSGAVTQSFQATIRYGNAAIVKKPQNITITPLPRVAVAFLFFDSYGNSWSQIGNTQTQAGAITVANSTDQIMNFLTADLKSSTGLEALKIVCLTEDQCSQFLAPATGKDKTVYIGVNMLIKDHRRDKADGYTTILADAAPSIDITVVYQ